MPRFFLEVAYLGTKYHGSQTQENANSVQAELERALETLYRLPFVLTGSSRTDAGVHALSNYYHLDPDFMLPARDIYRLNAILPPDIVIKRIHPVPPEAHCRFDAVSREYCYTIYPEKNPFLADRAFYFPYPLDRDVLQEAARLIRGYRDFSTFSKRNSQTRTKECTILHSAWEFETGQSRYRVRANRFLRGMVRGLTGTMLQAGRGKLSLEGFARVVAAGNPALADFSVPPQGLSLVRVEYPYALL